ncbi:MAG: sigma-70 family RNA polymerase sigma factor [Acidobacteriota bacterium]|nr:sigma-70 family RNA polymerase sigma factor [Acidobacteriota bacterium]
MYEVSSGGSHCSACGTPLKPATAPMNHQAITHDSFEALLSWLGPTRDEGARKYETIRSRLVRIFMKKGCTDPEDLADTAINRVTAKLGQIKDSYVGDPANYFCGVARMVYLESLRRKEITTDFFPVVHATDTVLDAARECLRSCLSKLSADQRDLVLDYHVDEKRARIESRRELAQELGLSANALRLRAYRIRAELEKCVLNCMGT